MLSTNHRRRVEDAILANDIGDGALFLVPLAVGGSWILARTIFRSSVRHSRRRLKNALDRLVSRLAVAAEGDAHEPLPEGSVNASEKAAPTANATRSSARRRSRQT